MFYHIDKNLIESLKLQVEKDKKEFHIFPYQNFVGYWHKLIYAFEIMNESLIYLTYNNNSIFKAEYANHTEIFFADSWYENNSLVWIGNWYLNFTLIPFASDMSSTIILNDIFLVKMSLNYDFFYKRLFFGTVSEILQFEQYLCFNSNLQILFVYFPLASILHYI
ncbi:MAG: hypothetical protein ACFFHD_15685 [Promethearchaeota archaeon]